MKESFAYTFLDLYLTHSKEIYQQDIEYIVAGHERFVLYEIYRRHHEGIEPFNLFWIEKTLGLSFPTVKKMVKKLVAFGYIEIKQSLKDKRNKQLFPTDKLINGIEAYEGLKESLLKKAISAKKNLLDFDKESIKIFANDIKEFRKDLIE
jgi:DNA-binding MarR family transcriptional regulator